MSTTAQSNTHDRVNQIRLWLKQNDLDAFIIPHEDAFLGEYLPERNDRLKWLTSFTGSAGAAVITQDSAAMFVDGRYTVQVTLQVPSDLFEYQHLMQNPPLAWLENELALGSKIAIDPRLHSGQWFKKAQTALGDLHDVIALEQNPIDDLWTDRPEAVSSEIKLMPVELAGQTSEQKRQLIAEKLTQQGADALVLTQIDSIAWLLNIRGLDIPRLPAVLCHAILNADSSLVLFIDSTRVPQEFSTHAGELVSLAPPADLEASLVQLSGKNVMLDTNSANAWFGLQLEAAGATIIDSSDPCSLPKAIKNDTESDGMRQCHITDGVAMVKFLHWLDTQVAQEIYHDEGVLADQLQAFRQENPTLVDLSFDTISAAGSNAAMCHYNHANQETYGKLAPESFYLVDSGGQYINGTTDITRTIAIGEPTPFMKQQYTLVLKGHIALAQAKFPQGTTGSQIDILARQFLWAHGYNYDHGTGHGVGHFLSVHEGPQRISPAYNNVALTAGMVVSNEPGYYREDEFGIRIENLEIVCDKSSDGDLNLVGFESLTRCPIDTRPIDFSLMTENEIAWLNEYHQKTWDDVSPLVEGDVKMWLEEVTQAVG